MCHQIYYKLIGIGLSKQTNTGTEEQNNFIRKLEEGNDATMFFITEKQQKCTLNFPLDSLYVIGYYKQCNLKNIKFTKKETILNFRPKNGTFSIINQEQVML